MKTCVDLEILSASVLEQEKVLPLSRCPEELHRLDDGFLRVYVRKLSVENAVPKKYGVFHAGSAARLILRSILLSLSTRQARSTRWIRVSKDAE